MGNEDGAVRDRDARDRQRLWFDLKSAAKIVRIWSDRKDSRHYTEALVRFGREVERRRAMDSLLRVTLRDKWLPAAMRSAT